MALVRQQATIARVGSGTSINCSFAATPAIGSLIVVMATGWVSGTKAVTDNQAPANTYTLRTSSTRNGSPVNVGIWTAVASAASGTFTVTASGGYTTVVIIEVRNQDGTTPVNDVSNTDSIGTSNAPVTAGLTSTVADCLVEGCMTEEPNNTMSTSAPWTQGQEEEDNATYQEISEIYQVAGAAGAYNPLWALSASANWVASGIAIAPSAGAPVVSIDMGTALMPKNPARRPAVAAY